MSAREGMSGARKLPSLNKQIIHEKKIARCKDEEKSFVYESHEEDSDEY